MELLLVDLTTSTLRVNSDPLPFMFILSLYHSHTCTLNIFMFHVIPGTKNQGGTQVWETVY